MTGLGVEANRITTVGPDPLIPDVRPPLLEAPEATLHPPEDLNGLNPSELDFLARISGSRVDNRPARVNNALPINETIFGTRQSSVSGSRYSLL